MKHTVLTVFLLLAAVSLGLFLPSAVTALQEQNTAQTEDSGVEGITLSLNSGMTQMEKLEILADPDCVLTNVGLGQHQTPSTLSMHSWQLLETMSSYGVPLLNAETTQQTEQFAIMATAGDTPFIYWEVLFTDAGGNRLRLHLDDETGLPLAMSYTCGIPKVGLELTAEWASQTLLALSDFCGIGLDSTRVVAAEGDTYFSIPITDGVISCGLLVQLGGNWFSIGNQIG